VLTLVVPMPPTLTNSAHGRSRHWRALEREKTAYWATLDTMQGPKPWRVPAPSGYIEYQLPTPPARPWASVEIRSTMYLGGAMDDENAMARHKWLVDWLRHRGYIADDRKKNVRWSDFPEQIVKRDGRYRIHLTITPLSR
jgi:hypothetical protein